MNILHGRNNAQTDTLSLEIFLEELRNTVKNLKWGHNLCSARISKWTLPEYKSRAALPHHLLPPSADARRTVTTDAMLSSLSWIICQVILHLLWFPNPHFCFHKILRCYLTLSKVAPLYDRTAYLLSIYVNSVVPLVRRPTKTVMNLLPMHFPFLMPA